MHLCCTSVSDYTDNTQLQALVAARKGAVVFRKTQITFPHLDNKLFSCFTVTKAAYF